jgi:hypothetical protein
MAKPLPPLPQQQPRKQKPLPPIPQQQQRKLKALPPIPQQNQDAPTPTQDAEDDSDEMIQGLNPDQINQLAQKVVDLWRDEMRLESERFGRNSFR